MVAEKERRKGAAEAGVVTEVSEEVNKMGVWLTSFKTRRIQTRLGQRLLRNRWLCWCRWCKLCQSV